MAPPSRHSGARSPISAKLRPPSAVESSPLFSETKLVLAIQTLDATWKISKCQSIPPANEEKCTKECAASTLLSDPVREALCTLLEIAGGLDKRELLTKSQLVTICSARVLGCLKRFVVNWTDTKTANIQCCERKCEQRLIDLVLLSILFRMCRESEIARSVVKEGLHKFLIRMCSTNEMWNPDLNVDVKAKQVAEMQELETFDPNDLMIDIDPFDWCYQPLCTRLMKENASAFLIPVGVQSLIRLLRGCSLPIDEVSEFEQQIHTNKGARTKRTKYRKLPSMFTFPLHDPDELCTLPETPHESAPLCWETRSALCEQREIRCLWSVVHNDGSPRHLALRSLIALKINLPRPSAEYRSLISEREYICRLLRAYNNLSSSQSVLSKAALWLSPENASDVDTPRAELPPYQLAATKGSTLNRIARSALSLFAEVQDANPSTNISTHQDPLHGRKTLSPIRTKQVHGKEELHPRDCDSLSIRYRLNGAANAAKSEITQWEHKYINHYHSLDVERSRRRLAIRKLCADVESLRRHLLGSLEVLCLGRQHPDPQQPFSEWIKSLPTLETLERERQSQQEMRQRQILELQYQREALRRRERDECAQMQFNDYNVPKESELSLRQEQHERFVRRQAEMRQLEENDSDKLKSTCKDDANAVRTPTKKEKLAIQERQRLQKLEDQRREGRELERMRREDLYYVERILQAKAKEKEEQDKRKKHTTLHTNAIDDQRQRIARMRMLDEEKKKAELEIGAMRTEDLFGRQMRYREAEKTKEQVQNEWRERKAMQVEEQDGRARWTLWERALIQQQQEELKQQRAEARRLKRQQKREEEQIRAAWVESWDQDGNKYYYNSVTGVSQWEAPSKNLNT